MVYFYGEGFVARSAFLSVYVTEKALSVVLIFIGAKMLEAILDIHLLVFLSFSTIIGAFVLEILLSFIFPKAEDESGVIEEKMSSE